MVISQSAIRLPFLEMCAQGIQIFSELLPGPVNGAKSLNDT